MKMTVQGIELPDQTSLFAKSQRLAIGHAGIGHTVTFDWHPRVELVISNWRTGMNRDPHLS